MLDLIDLVIRRPDGDVVIGGPNHTSTVRLDAGSIVLLTGPNGSGTSTLCRALTGRLERGWRLGGRITWRTAKDARGIDLGGLSAPDLAGIMGVALGDLLERAMRTRPAGNETAAQLVAAQARARLRRAEIPPATREALAVMHLDDVASHPSWRLTRSQRWALAVAQAIVGWPSVLVLDSLLAHLTDDARNGLLQLTPQLASRGCTVIWSEHLLEPVAAIADSVIEVHHGRATGCPIDSWTPQGLPPPLMQLADSLDLDHGLWPYPDRINEALREVGPPTIMATRTRPQIHIETEPAHPPIEVPTPTLGLEEADLTVTAGERIGILCHDPDQARGLVAGFASALGAPRVSRAEALLSRQALGSAFAVWDRVNPSARPTAEIFDALIGPGVQLPPGTLRPENLSFGQRMAARIAMLLAGTGPVVLTDPVAAMDPQMIERLAGQLGADDNRARAIVIIGTSPELLVRLCDRIIEIDAATIVQDAGPMFAQRSQPCRTTLSQACAPLLVTTVAQALALLGKPTTSRPEATETLLGQPASPDATWQTGGAHDY